MIAVGLMVVLVFVFAASLMLAARGHARSISSIAELNDLSRPVDLEAFRMLTLPSDEDYLRSSLPPREFTRVQRMRMRAAFEYVSRAAHNSAVLLRLGENNRRSENPQLAQAGAELADTAIQMRLLCLLALATIAVRIAFPQLRLSGSDICERYAATRDRVVSFGRIELPAFAGRIESSL
jgi:hypothetical protein